MKHFLIIIAIFFAVSISAQELKCNVTINSSKVQGTNKQIFETLQKALNDLMNNQRFTDMTFAQNERIECSFGIIVNQFQDNAFSCEMQIQARRPVWNSSYSTTILNFRDPSVNFTYFEFDPLVINTTSYDNNLTAIMAYYAYIIIGLDLDSFQKFGGTNYFSSAEQIVNMSQNRSGNEGDGWRAFDKNGKRYEFINNLVDERFKKFREYFYNYHRLGLDNMTSNSTNARAKIADGLPALQEINKLQPQAQAIVSFFDAKNDELVNIFAKYGTEKEKESVYQILTTINPTNTNLYNQIKQ